MATKNYFGFEFVKIGVAKLSDEPIELVYGGKPRKWNLILDLVHPQFAQAEQSTYLVFVGDELKYAGQYSGTFEERWLKKGSYIWHSDNIDYRIQPLLQDPACPEISVWLALAPYVAGPLDSQLYNINKALEQRIIEEMRPDWNTVGKSKRIGGKRVQDIWDQVLQFRNAP